MKIGIGLPNQVRGTRPTLIPGWARRGEQAGFSTLATVGRIAYPGLMDTVALAAAAATTTAIGLISNILLGPVWPPVLLAKETAAIDAISGGRLTLGLGVGVRPDDFIVEGLGLASRGQDSTGISASTATSPNRPSRPGRSPKPSDALLASR